MNFDDIVTTLTQEYKRGNWRNRTKRMIEIDRLIEEYFDRYGHFPAKHNLNRLATFILREELADKRKNKMQVQEYPPMSFRWEQVRKEQEAAFVHSDVIGIDRRNYRRPTRDFGKA